MRTNHRPAIARNVRAELARQGLTQRDLAAVLGLSQASVSGRMTGRIEFTASEVVSVAAWLGIPSARLLGEEAA